MEKSKYFTPDFTLINSILVCDSFVDSVLQRSSCSECDAQCWVEEARLTIYQRQIRDLSRSALGPDLWKEEDEERRGGGGGEGGIRRGREEEAGEGMREEV